MNTSLRRFARSRLGSMGVLAWLMLFSTSLAAAPLGMGHAAHATHATMVTAGPHCHHGMLATKSSASHGDDLSDCCGGSQASQSCYCAAQCGGALPTTPAVIMRYAAVALTYAEPSQIGAPLLATAPPLRPPSI